MEEMYWITRLDNVINFLGVILFLSLSAFIILFVFYLIEIDDSYFAQKRIGTFKTAMRVSFFTVIISTLSLIFTPTSSEVMMIYGVGSAIDYVKANEKVKELPDDMVDALIRCVRDIDNNDK